MLKKFKICIVGWYFNKKFLEYLSKDYFKETFIVAHRYNKILDDLNFNYKVTKNIGLEFGAYNYYIKKVWDGESNVLFMHDDVKIIKEEFIMNIYKVCSLYDHSYIWNIKKKKAHGRCLYLSKKTIKLFLKKNNGIWYDKKNEGFLEHNQPSSWHRKQCHLGIIKFHDDISSFVKIYNIKSKVIVNKDILLYRRGEEEIQKISSLNKKSKDYRMK